MTGRAALLGAILSLQALPTPAAPVEIAPRVMEPGLDCRGQFLAQSGCADGHCAITRRFPLSGPQTLDVKEHKWSVTLESENCWAAPVDIQPDTNPRREIDLWPRAAMEGSIAESVEKTIPPKMLRAHLSAPPGSGRIVAADIDCPVARGRWTCPIPATVIDVRLQRDGFAPVYLWDLKPARNAPLDAGAIHFARGASIAGWVTIPSKTKAETSVELVPKDGAGGTVTRVNERGFFQVAGIEPGTYDVKARAAGWSPALVRDVRVRSDEEHVLKEPLALQALASLSVTIVPPVAPDNAPWNITLSRPLPLSSSFRVMRQEPVHESGFWTGHDLEAETYRLTVRDSSGSVFATRDVDVRPPSWSEYVTIHAVRITGRVVAGDDPVRATLSFSDSGFRVKMDADHDGRFAGSLPHAGTWSVDLRLPSGTILRTRQVRVNATDDGEPETLTISLPGGRLAGVVVDEEGRPRAAMVRVSVGASVKAYVETGADGKFSMVALPAERVTIEADARDYGSGSVSRDLSGQSNEEEEIRVIAKRRNVAVRLLTPDGRPVSGAVVWQLLPPYWRRVEKLSKRDGTVELRVPDAGSVDAAVFAAGFPLKLLSLGRDVKNGLAVVLQPAGGRIQFHGTETRWPFIAPESGSFFPVASLFFTPNAGAPPYGFTASGFAPEFEPGTYTICPTAAFSAHCERQVLAPGMSIRSAVRPITEEP